MYDAWNYTVKNKMILRIVEPYLIDKYICDSIINNGNIPSNIPEYCTIFQGHSLIAELMIFWLNIIEFQAFKVAILIAIHDYIDQSVEQLSFMKIAVQWAVKLECFFGRNRSENDFF